jgi:hypothetical protein
LRPVRCMLVSDDVPDTSVAALGQGAGAPLTGLPRLPVTVTRKAEPRPITLRRIVRPYLAHQVIVGQLAPGLLLGVGCNALGRLLDGDGVSARVPERPSSIPYLGVELVGRQGWRLRSESCGDVVQVGEHPQTPICGLDALILPGHRIEIEAGEVWVEHPEHGSCRWLEAVHARPKAGVAGDVAVGRAGVDVAGCAEFLQPVSHTVAIHAGDRSVP